MSSTTPKPFVFVLMPFDPSFDDIYNFGIKAACHDAGAYCEHVDEQIFQESMLERIYNQISKADIIVADMTGKNPNVFYEAGYAHALGKSTILMTQKADDIPFDLKHYPHIVYGGRITALKADLQKRVRHFIQNPRIKRPDDYKRLEFLVEGQKIRTQKFVNIYAHRSESYQNRRNIKLWSFSFDIHNPTDKPIDISNVQYGLAFPVELGDPGGTFTGIMRLDNNSYMLCKNALPVPILPGGYVHEALALVKQDPVSLAGKHLPCSVKVFGEYASETIEFSFVVNEVPDPSVIQPGAVFETSRRSPQHPKA